MIGMWSFSAGHRTRSSSTHEVLLGLFVLDTVDLFLTWHLHQSPYPPNQSTDPLHVLVFEFCSTAAVDPVGKCVITSVLLFVPTGPVMFHVRRRPADSNSQAARRRKKKLSGSGSTGGNTSTSTINRLAVGGSGGGSQGAQASSSAHNEQTSPDDPERLPYLVELNPDGSEVRQANQTRRHVISPTVTEVGSERPAPPHPSSPIAGNHNPFPPFFSHLVQHSLCS